MEKKNRNGKLYFFSSDYKTISLENGLLNLWFWQVPVQLNCVRFLLEFCAKSSIPKKGLNR